MRPYFDSNTERLLNEAHTHYRRRHALTHSEPTPPNPSEESERQLKRIADQLKAQSEQSQKYMSGLLWILAIGFFLILVALS